MKKKILVILITFSIFKLFAGNSIISGSAGLLTGYPFYGSDEIKEQNKQLPNSYRILIGTLESFNIRLAEQVVLFVGADVLCDFNWKGQNYCNQISLDFPIGAKIYPNLGGFAVGLAYSLGFRSSFTKFTNNDMNINLSPWGNGIKVLVEYDFSHQNNKLKNIPTIGLYWKFMPRGNNQVDNHICAYIQENF